MKKLILALLPLLVPVAVTAGIYSYRFSATPLSEALALIAGDHPAMKLNFIYNELGNYTTSARIDTDNPHEALRLAVGLNPVSIIRDGDRFYVEALQHGKYLYTGRTTDTEGEPVVAATVMLLAPKDSTAITYGITDADGRFSIPCDRHDVIARFTCMGYAPAYRTCTGFSLGTVVMTQLPIQLNAIHADARNQTAYPDKTTYIPTPRQRNAAQNAIDLLRQMAIPQLSISLADNSVTTPTGQPVSIFINWLPASAQEIEGLLTADVRRIEYMDFPSDPRFNGHPHVINFIMQQYEYGGYTKATANENFLVGLSSRISVYSKFAYRRMTYDLYAGASNHDIHHAGTSITGNYRLGASDATPVQITRSESFDNARFKYNQYPVTFRATYDSDKTRIANTVGFNFDQSPVATTDGHIDFSGAATDGYSYTKSEPYTSRFLAWAGNYYFILPSGFHLSISPSANYGHTNYTYTYRTSTPAASQIENISRENSSQLRGSANLYRIFSNSSSAFVRAYSGITRNDVSYRGTSPYDNRFSDTYAGAAIGYRRNTRRWSLNADAAVQWERNEINSTSVSEAYPLVNLSASFSPSPSHSVQAYFHFGANYPGASEKTPNVLRLNELMYQTGNPDLKLSRQVTANMQYNWIPRRNFSTTFFAQYFGEYDLYVPVFTPYDGGKALLRGYDTDGTYHRTQVGLSFNLHLAGNKIQLAAQPSVYFYRMTGHYDISKTPFSIHTSATFYLNDFYFQASYQTPERTVQGNRAVYYKDRDFYQLLAGWSKCGWNVRLTAINMFRSDWIGATQTLNSPLYSETRLVGGNYFHRRLNLSVTYTLNYGKKVQQGNEVGEQSGAASAIMK